MTSDAAVDILWEAMQKGVYFPETLKGKLSLEEGYRAQLGILARHIAAGEKQAGWKIALSGEATRQAIGVYAPAFGYLLASGHFSSGQTFQSDDIFNSAIESELCLTLGEGLKGPGVSLEQARAAISAVQPAFEIVEKRGDFAADPSLSLADNVQQKYFVTGEAVPLNGDGDALSRTVVEIFINGESVQRADGSSVMGDPAASVAWLANRLAAYGKTLQAGLRIMSGSFTRQFPIGQGDVIEAKFKPFGEVSAEFQ